MVGREAGGAHLRGEGMAQGSGCEDLPICAPPSCGLKGCWGHPTVLGHSMVMGSCFSSAERIYSKACQIEQFLPQGAWPEQRRRRNSRWKIYPQAQSFSRIVRYLTRNTMKFLFGKTEGAGYLLQTRLFSSCKSQDVSIHPLYVAIAKILVCQGNSKASL